MRKKLVLGFMLMLLSFPFVAAAQENGFVFDFDIPPQTTVTTESFYMNPDDNISIYVTLLGFVEVAINDATTQDVKSWDLVDSGTYLLNHTFLGSGNFYIVFYNQLRETSYVNGSCFLNVDLTNVTLIPTYPTWPTYPTNGTWPTYPGPTVPTDTGGPSNTFRFLFWDISIDWVFGLATGVFSVVIFNYFRNRGKQDFSYLEAFGNEELLPAGALDNIDDE
jgi:hypothetical protein